MQEGYKNKDTEALMCSRNKNWLEWLEEKQRRERRWETGLARSAGVVSQELST